MKQVEDELPKRYVATGKFTRAEEPRPRFKIVWRDGGEWHEQSLPPISAHRKMKTKLGRSRSK